MQIELESPAFEGVRVLVQRVEGREELSRTYELRTDVWLPEGTNLDIDAIVGSAARLVFRRGEAWLRHIFGVIAEAEELMLSEPGYISYRLTVVPRAFYMTLTERLEVFVDKTLSEILEAKLHSSGLHEKDLDFKLKLKHEYPKREFVFQYKENDLQFVSRLCEHLGITFFFDHSGDRERMVFSDDNKGYTKADGPAIEFWKRGQESELSELRFIHRTIPNRVKVSDYDYHAPALDLTFDATISGKPGREVFEYGANYATPDAGKLIVRVRAEELLVGKATYEGKSTVASLTPGTIAVIDGHPRGSIELLIIEVRHEYARPDGNNDATSGYRNSFRAIPSDVTYRPTRRTAKPRVSGMLTGTIDAAKKGDYADVDAEGRYRVRFHFDGASEAGGHASAALRMAQPHAGPNYGMHFPLRPGIEVIITFIDGDPDRPVIAGCVPNALTPSPVSDKNLTSNVIRTGGNNEIFFEDTKGNERIKLSSPHMSSTLQIGSPNAAEKGIAATTAGNIAMVSGGMATGVSPFMNQFAHWNSTMAGNSITLAEKSAIERAAFIAEILATIVGVTAKVAGVTADELEKKPKEKEADEAEEEATEAEAKDNAADVALIAAKKKRAAVCAQQHLEDDASARARAEEWKDSEDSAKKTWAKEYLEADEAVKAAEEKKDETTTEKAGAAAKKKAAADKLKIDGDAEKAAQVTEVLATVVEGATALISGLAAIMAARASAKQIGKAQTSWNASKITAAEAMGAVVPAVPDTWLEGLNINAGENCAAIRGDHALVAGVETRIHGYEKVDMTSHVAASVIANEVSVLGRQKGELRANHGIWIGAKPLSVGGLHPQADAWKVTEGAAIGAAPPPPAAGLAPPATVHVTADDKLTLMSETNQVHAWSFGGMKLESAESVTMKVAAFPPLPPALPLPSAPNPPPAPPATIASVYLNRASSSVEITAVRTVTAAAGEIHLNVGPPPPAGGLAPPPTWGAKMRPNSFIAGSFVAPLPQLNINGRANTIALGMQVGPNPDSGLHLAMNKATLTAAAVEVSAGPGDIDLNATGPVTISGAQILIG